MTDSKNFEHKVGDILFIYDTKEIIFFYLSDVFKMGDSSYFSFIHFNATGCHRSGKDIKIKSKKTNDYYLLKKNEYIEGFTKKGSWQGPIDNLESDYVWRLNEEEQEYFQRIVNAKYI